MEEFKLTYLFGDLLQVIRIHTSIGWWIVDEDVALKKYLLLRSVFPIDLYDIMKSMFPMFLAAHASPENPVYENSFHGIF